MEYYLGLGSNLGQREKNLKQALKRLEEFGITLQKISSIYETQPFGNSIQPWYMNIVAKVKTDLPPHKLFAKIKKIEKEMGRTLHGMNNPRPIDIDILFLEDKVVKSNKLEIPHKELANRNFVLVPLMEIASHFIHPVLNESMKNLLKKCKDDSIVRRLKNNISI